MSELRRTPLHEAHVEAGAKLMPFAGCEMPVQYPDGITAEHEAVRNACGVFDVSHMGQIEVRGRQALEFLQRALSNDASKVEVGGSQYSCLCEEGGGVLDDLFSYRLADERWLSVTNASNHPRDFERFEVEAKRWDVEVEDVAENIAMLAVQGPEARRIVGGICDDELPGRFQVASASVAGSPMLVCGTGYTGEDGVELLMPPEAALSTWMALVSAGAVPAGLGARDTVRLEACYCLYGNELSLDRTPIEAGLGWAVKEETGFIGSEACLEAREDAAGDRLVAFRLPDGGIPRNGNPILKDGARLGEVTSGTLSPTLDLGIAMGYVPGDLSDPGTEIEIDVRGKVRKAVVDKMPLYSRDG
ncbi:MAG: glycine cleavage system aminomethyltransferase GcvT [bacterium]